MERFRVQLNLDVRGLIIYVDLKRVLLHITVPLSLSLCIYVCVCVF